MNEPSVVVDIVNALGPPHAIGARWEKRNFIIDLDFRTDHQPQALRFERVSLIQMSVLPAASVWQPMSSTGLVRSSPPPDGVVIDLATTRLIDEMTDPRLVRAVENPMPLSQLALRHYLVQFASHHRSFQIVAKSVTLSASTGIDGAGLAAVPAAPQLPDNVVPSAGTRPLSIVRDLNDVLPPWGEFDLRPSWDGSVFVLDVGYEIEGVQDIQTISLRFPNALVTLKSGYPAPPSFLGPLQATPRDITIDRAQLFDIGATELVQQTAAAQDGRNDLSHYYIYFMDMWQSFQIVSSPPIIIDNDPRRSANDQL